MADSCHPAQFTVLTIQELRKDTDWLWELFLLQDYPTFHASSLLKRGVKRTSGWRRMYKVAMEEARQKQANAEARLAERYKELEEEKERKKVKVLDRAPGKGKRVGGGVYGARTEPGEFFIITHDEAGHVSGGGPWYGQVEGTMCPWLSVVQGSDFMNEMASALQILPAFITHSDTPLTHRYKE